MRHRLHALWRHLTTENASPRQLSASVFVGILLGVIPLYGIQTPIVLLVAQVFRLNKLTAVAASQISIPPFAPFLIAGGIALGQWLRFGTVHRLDLSQARDFVSSLALFSGEVPSLFLSCLLGDTIIGLVLGALGALITYRIARRRQPSEPCSQSDARSAEAP